MNNDTDDDDYDNIKAYGVIIAIVKEKEKWNDYVLNNHLEKIQELSAINSWSAKEILEKAGGEVTKTMKDINLSKKFFFGRDSLYNSLKQLYNQ